MPLKLDDYKLSDWTDDSINPVYLGYVTIEGHWYIKKIDNSSRTMRYAAGLSEYTTNWGLKDKIDYFYIHEVL